MSLEVPHGLRILITEDHPIFREGFKKILNGSGHTVLEAESGEEALELLENERVDIVMMDIRLPGMDGIETTRKIKARFKKVKVLALSMHGEERFFIEMMEAGASGYLTKTVGKEELLESITVLESGENYFGADLPEDLKARYQENGELPSPRPVITPREKEILCLICEELTNAEIADRLSISRRTVDTHRKNLLRKLGARNTVGMVRYALRTGLIED